MEGVKGGGVRAERRGRYGGMAVDAFALAGVVREAVTASVLASEANRRGACVRTPPMVITPATYTQNSDPLMAKNIVEGNDVVEPQWLDKSLS